MKRSDFSGIVESVCNEQFDYLQKKIKSEMKDGKMTLDDFISVLIAEIPEVAARTTADLLLQSGAVVLEDDA